LTKVQAEQVEWHALAPRLLECGGTGIAARYEEDISSILSRGTCLDGRGAKLVEGKPISCHANAAALYELDERNGIMTGWALSDDGLWRQHSWCLREGAVLETTVLRRLYYGFELDEDESEVFVMENN